MAFASAESMSHGAKASSQMLHGQLTGPTVTVVCVTGCSRLPVSSTARLRMFAVPVALGRQLYDQLLVPLAGCHVAPPSADTSTPPTTPPPPSAAVPVIATRVPAAMTAPAAGEAIADVGAVESLLGKAGNSPACLVCG